MLVAVEATNDKSSVDTFVLQRRDVEVLRFETDRVLIRGTLEPGERVVVTGIHKLVAGQHVRLLADQ